MCDFYFNDYLRNGYIRFHEKIQVSFVKGQIEIEPKGLLVCLQG